MTRNSKFSQKNYLAATSLKPNKTSRDLSLTDQLMETKLRSEQARLKLLEAELPEVGTPKHTRWADMPPPTPEDEADFHRRFNEIVRSIVKKPIGPEVGQTVQDWLTEQGAVIPDLPEWQAPLYLGKWVRTRKTRDRLIKN